MTLDVKSASSPEQNKTNARFLKDDNPVFLYLIVRLMQGKHITRSIFIFTPLAYLLIACGVILIRPVVGRDVHYQVGNLNTLFLEEEF